MKNFLVNLSKKHKELLSSLLLALVTGIVLLAALFGINKTVAWFASNKEVDADGLAVAVKGPKYDILIERDYTEFDRVEGNHNTAVYPGISDLRDKLASEGYSSVSTDVSVNNAGLLAFDLVNLYESFEDLYYMMPGAYGYLIFYVRPVDPSEDLQIEFELSTEGYFDHETQGMTRVTDDEVRNLLKGHLLFFEDRTGDDLDRSTHFYSDFIDGTYVFDSMEHTLITEGPLAGCYKVKLYWEWPLTYPDIFTQLSDSENTRKYPAEVGTFIDNNRTCVFAQHADSSDLDELSDGYDDGDQTIGNSCEYLVVFVTAYTDDD